jgi:hypothetical protein
MLRIHKLTPKQSNGAAYYTDLASKDLTAYYAGMGEAPSHWIGSGLAEYPYCSLHDVVVPPTGQSTPVAEPPPTARPIGTPGGTVQGADGVAHNTFPPTPAWTQAEEHCSVYRVPGAPLGIELLP